MSRARALAAALCVASCGACGLFFDVDALGRDAPGAADAAGDATNLDGAARAPDAASDGATRPGDGSTTDASTDASIDASGSDGRGPTGLDDGVVLPDLDGAVCDPFGGIGACTVTGTCRIATPDSGRCETCDGGRCLGHPKDPCTHTYDCDARLGCFRGTCTPECLLGSTECGKPVDCVDIGYLGYGLCNPSAL